MKMAQHGLISRLIEKYFPRSGQCRADMSPDKTELAALNLNELLIVFLLLGGGMIFSFFAFDLEILFAAGHENIKLEKGPKYSLDIIDYKQKFYKTRRLMKKYSLVFIL